MIFDKKEKIDKKIQLMSRIAKRVLRAGVEITNLQYKKWNNAVIMISYGYLRSQTGRREG